MRSSHELDKDRCIVMIRVWLPFDRERGRDRLDAGCLCLFIRGDPFAHLQIGSRQKNL